MLNFSFIKANMQDFKIIIFIYALYLCNYREAEITNLFASFITVQKVKRCSGAHVTVYCT